MGPRHSYHHRRCHATKVTSVNDKQLQDTVLDFRDVSLVRGGAHLLNDVTWRVLPGQRWVVLGSNGAGKTTLLQLASALIHPSSGSVHILGEQMGQVDVFELRPRIGLASAALAERVPPGERVIDAVQTAAYAVLGRFRESYDSQDTTRAEHLLEALGCAGLQQRTFGTLSEGERKRVQIARALMTDPELLLLDEPAAGLDLGARADLMARIDALATDTSAPCLVLVTHHVEEISPAVTHALLLQQGRVVTSGPVEQALTDDHVSTCFGVRVQVERHSRGLSARLA